ncbi:hypothetical protein NKR23_g765 [Pleurostoma richardsiae]|uniref:Large ribosomal subunit protein mL54 n=1 Tax=Pleurostoma richardsiae TaxID=41990 RepID=A0AA38RTG9_9PEZI|nr:hypothetical protein NKR23_g765 [Pleurostoma richardsiae]
MICRTCLQRASAIGRFARPSASRAISTTLSSRAAAAASSASAPSLTDPLTPPSSAASEADAAGEAAAALSSCPPGTVLAGLNYFKGKQDPVAKRDDEYPSWLWECLSVKKTAATADADDAGDEFSKSKKQRRLAAKKQRELEARILASGDLSALAPKIPLQQQSINLPGEGGSTEDALMAAAKREELRRAMRKERKSKIKESNYLKSM